MIHYFLTSSAIDLRTHDVAVPKHDRTIILRHPPASSPDGNELPFILIAAFLLVLHQCHHTQLDPFFALVLVVSAVGWCLLHQSSTNSITMYYYNYYKVSSITITYTIDLHSKSMDWFLRYRDLSHKRVNNFKYP